MQVEGVRFMTNLITEARELCEMATPGPWEVKLHNEDYGQGYGETTFFVDMGGTLLKIGVADSAEKYAQYSALSTLVARSRTLIPELLDLLAEMDAEIARLTKALHKTDIDCDHCKHNHGGECENADFDCMTCDCDCICKSCRDNSNWEWRGATDN